jgi:biopolymer transport protein ExbD
MGKGGFDMKVHVPTKKAVRIEMLPLIDIVFLLLVFFIYAMLSMAVHRALPVTLPRSQSAKIDQHQNLAITIKADGAVYVDRDRINLEDLTAALKARQAEASQAGILLFADRELPYQRLFEVLDHIRLAGLTSISLQAEAE